MMAPPGKAIVTAVRCIARPEASPTGSPLTVDQLLGQALALYRSAFAPLLGAAAIGALLSAAIGALFSPSSFLQISAWLFITFVPLAIAQAAILVMVVQKRSGAAPDIVSGYTLALGVSPTFVLASVVYAGSVLLALGTLLLFPVALFLLTRWALYGPAIVIEGAAAAPALRRSWRLTDGFAMRTLGVQMLMIAARFIAQLVALGVAAVAGGGVGPTIVVGGLAVALVQPMWTITNLLLFEDYRRIADERERIVAADASPPPELGTAALPSDQPTSDDDEHPPDEAPGDEPAQDPDDLRRI